MIPKIISSVTKNDLCCGCGACVGICPAGCLSIDAPDIEYTPTLNGNNCTDCDLCYKVCPGKGWNVIRYANDLLLRDNSGSELDYIYGPNVGYYMGKSYDDKIAVSGASGGVGTGILLYLLDSKAVDEVIIVGMEHGKPAAVITDKREDILQCAGSKYSPIPLMADVIKLLKQNRNKKFAITLIPCQMAALYNAAQIDKSINIDSIFTVGLFCNDIKEYSSVFQVAKSLGFQSENEYDFIGWRYGKWPGDITYKNKHTNELVGLSCYKWLGIASPFYALERCLMCPARENWIADIALADNHKGQTDETVIVARTKKGKYMLTKAMNEGYVRLNDMNCINCKPVNVRANKFYPAISLIRKRRKQNKEFPLYDYDEHYYISNTPISHRLVFRAQNSLRSFVRKKSVKQFLERHPALLKRCGYFVNRFPFISAFRQSISKIRG